MSTALLRAGKPRSSVVGHRNAAGWLHVCNGLDPRRDGGMVPAILGLTGALAGQGGEVAIQTTTPSRLAPGAAPQGVSLKGPDRGSIDRGALAAAIRSAEVLHLHGLWQSHTRLGAPMARRWRVPYLIAAHGMAEPWALRHKWLKKRVYLSLIEASNLRRAACLHALSRPEVGHLHALAPRTPVCLVPNGVDLRPFNALPARTELEAEFPELRGKFVLLFLGRLHAKKGLDLLAEALAAVRHDWPNLHLLIAGPDDGALAPFLNQLAALGLATRATCVGHVAGERARQIWGAADAFVLPSYSEGFSMAVLEALACRLPVLITTACHFPELAAAEAGLVVEPSVASVTSGLRDLLERSPVERSELAARGRVLVESRFTWQQQAQRLADVYRWLTGGGTPPEAVQ